MRMPCEPIEISMSPLPSLPCGRSILISGWLGSLPSAPTGADGGVGGFGGVGITTTRGALVSTVSETVQLNGGRFCSTPALISSSSDSSKKRFQVIDTSQLA